MRAIFLSILIATCHVFTVHACECSAVSFTQEFDRADYVFIGTVVKKDSSNEVLGLSYTFLVSNIFKGPKAETIILSTGSGGGDCGMLFEIGKRYLVYSTNGATNRCRRNSVLEKSHDLGKLRYLFDKGFSEHVGKSDSTFMTEQEALYFNDELSSQLNGFDFINKKAAFYSNGTLISKQVYFEHWGGKDIPIMLIMLTDDEKQQNQNYDAILVLNESKKVKKGFRRKVIELLK